MSSLAGNNHQQSKHSTLGRRWLHSVLEVSETVTPELQLYHKTSVRQPCPERWPDALTNRRHLPSISRTGCEWGAHKLGNTIAGFTERIQAKRGRGAYTLAGRGLQGSTLRFRSIWNQRLHSLHFYQDALKFAPKFSRKGQWNMMRLHSSARTTQRSLNNSESCTTVQRCSWLPQASGVMGNGKILAPQKHLEFSAQAEAVFLAQVLVASLWMSLR